MAEQLKITYCLCGIASGRPIYLNPNNLKQNKCQQQLDISMQNVITCYFTILAATCYWQRITMPVQTPMLTSPSMISVSSLMRTPIALRNACHSVKQSFKIMARKACATRA